MLRFDSSPTGAGCSAAAAAAPFLQKILVKVATMKGVLRLPTPPEDPRGGHDEVGSAPLLKTLEEATTK